VETDKEYGYYDSVDVLATLSVVVEKQMPNLKRSKEVARFSKDMAKYEEAMSKYRDAIADYKPKLKAYEEAMKEWHIWSARETLRKLGAE
jgi:hypothetical protein